MEANLTLILWAIVGSSVFVVMAVALILLVMKNHQLLGENTNYKLDRITKRLDDEDFSKRLALLTYEERRVADRAADGLSQKEIADQLNKSISTVKAQLKKVYQKLDIHKNTELTKVMKGIK